MIKSSDIICFKFVLFAMVALIAVLAYVYGLDSQHIPTNGDAYPYTHITRMTAANGKLLPLQSEIDGMRNTKPPMLFWQGIASTNWGNKWQNWRLRWPSVLYTLLMALLVYMVASRHSGWQLGLAGAACYLSFISTYRYGRPFLTDPPLVFWMSLPFMALLYRGKSLFSSRWVFPVLAGGALGVGFLYKSFMLALPAGVTLALWYRRERGYEIRPFLRCDAPRIILMMVIGLGVFSLWFVMDPAPEEIWREFIVHENIGKIDKGHYLIELLWGGSSVWSLFFETLLATGILIFPTIVLLFKSVRRIGELSDVEKMLWLWIIAYFIIFSLSSQRSSRYLLPIMPAIAVLLGIKWKAIPAWALRTSLAFAGIVVTALTYACWRLEGYLSDGSVYPIYVWVILIASLVLIAIGIVKISLARSITPIAGLLSFLCLAAFFYPYDHEYGRYHQEVIDKVQGSEVWVPYNFVAKYERYRFLLPGAEIRGYRSRDGLPPEDVPGNCGFMVFYSKLDSDPHAIGDVVATRLDVRTRHNSREIKEILFGGRIDYLFVKEYLVRCPVKEGL